LLLEKIVKMGGFFKTQAVAYFRNIPVGAF
jgi:hypothetical protein